MGVGVWGVWGVGYGRYPKGQPLAPLPVEVWGTLPPCRGSSLVGNLCPGLGAIFARYPPPRRSGVQ